jgi:hypothetical protein
VAMTVPSVAHATIRSLRLRIGDPGYSWPPVPMD